jgi:hypothetical protein
MASCYGCAKQIRPRQAVNHHHVIYRSKGGTITEPMHQKCHVKLHSTRDDFKGWGRVGGQKSALDNHWSFYLRNVKDNPAYDSIRAAYIRKYSKGGLPPVINLTERDLTNEGWKVKPENLTLADTRLHIQIARAVKRVVVRIGDFEILLKGRGRKVTLLPLAKN